MFKVILLTKEATDQHTENDDWDTHLNSKDSLKGYFGEAFGKLTIE